MLVLGMNYCYIFWPGKANARTATWTFWSSYVNMILACASVLPLTAIHNNSLYMILACVAKGWSYVWIIGTFSGQERPTQEELRGRSRLFTSIWFWLLRLLYQWQLYIRTAYTWFWLLWPNAGLTHVLLLHFLARKGQHKNSYIDVLVFLRQYDSGLCVCSTIDSYT